MDSHILETVELGNGFTYAGNGGTGEEIILMQVCCYFRVQKLLNKNILHFTWASTAMEKPKIVFKYTRSN